MKKTLSNLRRRGGVMQTIKILASEIAGEIAKKKLTIAEVEILLLKIKEILYESTIVSYDREKIVNSVIDEFLALELNPCSNKR